MMDFLLPFHYSYMVNAFFISVLVIVLCASLSPFLIIKNWCLLSDGLGHCVIPGVVGSFALSLPFALGGFITASFAIAGFVWLTSLNIFKKNTIITLIFTSFLGCGLFINSLLPVQLNLHSIVLGHVFSLGFNEIIELLISCFISLTILALKWKEFRLVFFDQNHSISIGFDALNYKLLFFIILTISITAALQVVGAFLVVAVLILPGATANLLTAKFSNMISISVFIGAFSAFIGTYLTFFIGGATGALIVLLQAGCFFTVLIFKNIRSEIGNK